MVFRSEQRMQINKEQKRKEFHGGGPHSVIKFELINLLLPKQLMLKLSVRKSFIIK